jgi:hypothetical protein
MARAARLGRLGSREELEEKEGNVYSDVFQFMMVVGRQRRNSDLFAQIRF